MDFACTNFNIHHIIPGTMDVNTLAKDILTKAVPSKSQLENRNVLRYGLYQHRVPSIGAITIVKGLFTD